MLATQIRQKDGIFYFGSYRAKELLDKVRFISRFYGETEEIAPARISQDDEIAQFIAKIERNDSAFQRCERRRHGERFAFGIESGVEYFDGHMTASGCADITPSHGDCRFCPPPID